MVATGRLPRLARYTWRYQWPAVLLEGASVGVVALAPFIVRRSLGAAEWWVPFLIALWQSCWIFAPALGPWLSRTNPQRVWRVLGVLAHAPLLLVAFVAVEPSRPLDLPLFLVAISLFFAGGIGYVPHRGALIRTNYDQHVRGRMYGRLVALSVVATVLASKAGGWLLDWDARSLRVLFPVAAVLGYAAFARQARIRWRGQRSRRARRPAGWAEMLRILKEDRAFRTFEIGFMLYGFGFLMTWPLLVLFAEGELKMSYDAFTWAQGVAFPAAQIAGLMLWGRISDGLGMVRTTGYAFLSLAGFLIFLQFVSTAPLFVAGYALFGLAMAGVNVAWSLGPLHFAPDGEAHMYAAVHFSLVGVRSVVAPFLGYAVKELFSYRAGFGASLVAMLLAVFVLRGLARRESAPSLMLGG